MNDALILSCTGRDRVRTPAVANCRAIDRSDGIRGRPDIPAAQLFGYPEVGRYNVGRGNIGDWTSVGTPAGPQGMIRGGSTWSISI